MYTNSGSGKTTNAHKNTVEALTDLGSSMAQSTVSQVSEIGTGIFDQLLNTYKEKASSENHEATPKQKKKEVNLFSYTNHHETEVRVREIKSLTEEIKKAVDVLKSQASEAVKDAGKLTVEPISEKPGIYHERFLESIITFLKMLRAQIGESSTWMQALVSKKKKRGSLFAAMSKKKGTQYSMSQELSNARSIQ